MKDVCRHKDEDSNACKLFRPIDWCKGYSHCPNYEEEQMVRAKFYVDEVSVDSGIIKLSPVIDGSEENKKFFNYTPFGEIEIGIVNPEVIKEFEVGKEYYVDFTKVI